MGFLYLITALLDLVVCLLFCVQASFATTDFRIGVSIFCASCCGICFVLNLIMTIDDFKK